MHICVCACVSMHGSDVQEHLTTSPKTIATNAGRCQPAEVSAPVRKCSEIERIIYIFIRRQRRNERNRQRRSEREQSDRFQWQCAFKPLPLCFFTQRLWWSAHMKVKEALHAAKEANGTITGTKQLSTRSQSQLVWRFTSPYLQHGVYSELKLPSTEPPPKKATDTHPCVQL